MLTTTYEMLQDAYKGHYAVPAIDAQGRTYDIIWAVYVAAGELRSPVILAHYVGTGVHSGHSWFYETTKWTAVKVPVSVTIHLDHGNSLKRCTEMLKLGFTPIILDDSALPVEESAAATEAVAGMCRSFGVPLEVEIGELCRLDDRGNKMGVSNIVNPDVVRQYLKLCHPDSLVIGIGNVHGSHNGPVDIRAGALEEHRKFMDIPFVLHECTSMDKKLVKRPIDSGVTKINSGTQVCRQYMNHLREGLAEGRDQGHTWRLSQCAKLRLHEDIKNIIRLAGSQERA